MTKPLRIGFKRRTDDAIIPTKAHPSDSGYDLFANEDVIIGPGETVIVKTGVAVQLPEGYEAQIRPRSGITAKTKLRVQLGTIDNDYRGELGVIVDNIRPYNEGMSEWHTTMNETYAQNRVRKSCTCGHFQHVRYRKGTYLIRKGDRIAQLVIQRLPETEAVEIDDFSEDSERGEGGFGSTGV